MNDTNEMSPEHNAQPNHTHQNTRMCVLTAQDGAPTPNATDTKNQNRCQHAKHTVAMPHERPRFNIYFLNVPAPRNAESQGSSRGRAREHAMHQGQKPRAWSHDPRQAPRAKRQCFPAIPAQRGRTKTMRRNNKVEFCCRQSACGSLLSIS